MGSPKKDLAVLGALCVLEFYLPVLLSGQSAKLAAFAPLNIAFFYPLFVLVAGMIAGRRIGRSWTGVFLPVTAALPGFLIGLFAPAGVLAGFADVRPIRLAVYYVIALLAFTIGGKGHEKDAACGRFGPR